MTPAQRREARAAFLMLPVGAVVLITALLGFGAVLLLGVAAPFRGGAWWWTELWCLAALAVALKNALAGIAMMAAFDWRPLPPTLLLSSVIVAGWLALP